MDDQLWFIIWEGFSSDEEYRQISRTKAQLQKEGLTLAKLLHLVRPQAELDKYQIYLYSKSMSAAVVMLTDEAILVTWQLYCRKDEVIQVFIRLRNDPSPNASTSPSHNNSFAERRRVSGNARRTTSDLFTHSQLSLSTEAKNPGDLEPVAELPTDEKVAIKLATGEKEVFTKQYLLGYIQGSIEKGTRLTDIIVTAMTPTDLGPLYEAAFDLKYDDFKNEVRNVSAFPIAGKQEPSQAPAGKENKSNLKKVGKKMSKFFSRSKDEERH